jgi:hypothetical protein
MTTSLTMSLHPLAEISSKGEDGGGGRRTAAILSRWSGGETVVLVYRPGQQNMLIVFHLPESFCQRVFNNTKQIY